MLLCLFFGSHPKKSSEQDVRCFHCGWWFLYHAYTLGKILAGSRAIVCSSKALHWNHQRDYVSFFSSFQRILFEM